MTMRATLLAGLVALSAVSVDGAEVRDSGERVSHPIVVVNGSATQVRVYVEDSEGRRYELGSLERGQTSMFEAPSDVLERGEFRVRVHPGYYAQHLRDPARITTRSLTIEDGETVILWLERELSRSTVEVRKTAS